MKTRTRITLLRKLHIDLFGIQKISISCKGASLLHTCSCTVAHVEATQTRQSGHYPCPGLGGSGARAEH